MNIMIHVVGVVVLLGLSLVIGYFISKSRCAFLSAWLVGIIVMQTLWDKPDLPTPLVLLVGLSIVLLSAVLVAIVPFGVLGLFEKAAKEGRW